MATRKASQGKFDTAAAIRELEAQKEEKRLAKIQRQKEAERNRKEKEMTDYIAKQEEKKKLLEDERYFRLMLLDSIASLTDEVSRLSTAMEQAVSSEDPATRDLLNRIASCIGVSSSSGLAHIRAKYIPKDYF